MWKAKTLYRLAYRLPARFHGISRRLTTVQLLRRAGDERESYSRALQACLEGERAVHASELNEPLMIWNACWRLLGKRLHDRIEWDYRHMVLRENMELLENPDERQLWKLVDSWMSVREREDEVREMLVGPVQVREHVPYDWQKLDNFPEQD